MTKGELTLTDAEIDCWMGTDRKPRLVPQAPLARIRDTHHWLARAIASGRRHCEVAAECGYSQSRISILMADPTFRELVAHYREQFGTQDMGSIMASRTMMEENFRKFLRLQADLADDLAERYESGEAIPAGTVLDNVVSLADRLGHGKQQTNINVDANGLADRIAAARKAYLNTTADEPPALPSLPSPEAGQ